MMCQPLCKALRQSTDLKKLEVIETHVHMVQKRYHKRGYDIRSTKHDTHTCTQRSGYKSPETSADTDDSSRLLLVKESEL